MQMCITPGSFTKSQSCLTILLLPSELRISKLNTVNWTLQLHHDINGCTISYNQWRIYA